MNKYTLVYKKNHRPFRNQPVMLDEYMVFRDKTDDSCVLLPKWVNKTSYLIEEITVSITQLNENNENISKAHYTFKQLAMGPFKTLVTLEKISVDPNCTHIEANLEHIKASNQYWENGIWKKEETNKEDEISNNNTEKVIVHTLISSRIHFPIYISFIVLVIYVLFIVGVFYAINR